MTSTHPYNPASMLGIRDTFGIVDAKTGKLYPDIIASHLDRTTFSQAMLFKKTVLHADREYLLHMDSKLKRALKSVGLGDYIPVIISYQERTTGCFAIARLPLQNRS